MNKERKSDHDYLDGVYSRLSAIMRDVESRTWKSAEGEKYHWHLEAHVSESIDAVYELQRDIDQEED